MTQVQYIPSQDRWANLGSEIGQAIGSGIAQQQADNQKAKMFQDFANLYPETSENIYPAESIVPGQNIKDQEIKKLLPNTDFLNQNPKPPATSEAASLLPTDFISQNLKATASPDGGNHESAKDLQKYIFDNPLSNYAPRKQQLSADQQIDNTMNNHFQLMSQLAAKGYDPQVFTPLLEKYTAGKLQKIQTADTDSKVQNIMTKFNTAPDLKTAIRYIPLLEKYGVKMDPSLMKQAFQDPEYKTVSLDLGGQKRVYAFNPKNPQTGAIDMIDGTVTTSPDVLARINADMILTNIKESNSNYRAGISNRSQNDNIIRRSMEILARHNQWLRANKPLDGDVDETQSPYYRYLPSAQAALDSAFGTDSSPDQGGGGNSATVDYGSAMTAIDSALRKNAAADPAERWSRGQFEGFIHQNYGDLGDKLISDVDWSSFGM